MEEAGATVLMYTSRYFSLYTLGAVLVILLLVVFAFKKPLIVNPVARFVSKLFLNPGDNE